MPSLLVTNDFPPKVGGIQSYLWELWRRLPPDQVAVLTTPYAGSEEFDRAQPFRVVRDKDRVLFPTPALAGRIDALARDLHTDVIFLDPALPLGALGPRLRAAPYVVVLHGAEVTVPGRLPGSRALLRRVLDGAAGVLAAGTYPAEEAARAAGRPLPGLVIPPGVDLDRFRPQRRRRCADAQERFGLPEAAPLVLGVSRLVPRKGFDVLIDAVARLDRAGSSRCTSPWRGVAGTVTAWPSGRPGPGSANASTSWAAFPTRISPRCTPRPTSSPCAAGNAGAGSKPRGSASSSWKRRPAVYRRWPAAAAGRGRPWRTDRPASSSIPSTPAPWPPPLERLLADPDLRRRMGTAARARAEQAFSYDTLAARLVPLARGDLSVLTPVGGPRPALRS